MGDSRVIDRLLTLVANMLLTGIVVVLALLLVEVRRMLDTDGGIVINGGLFVRLSNSYFPVELSSDGLGGVSSPIYVTSRN